MVEVERRVQDGGRQVDRKSAARKSAGPRALEGVTESGPIQCSSVSASTRSQRAENEGVAKTTRGDACAAKNERRRDTKPRNNAQFIRKVDQDE